MKPLDKPLLLEIYRKMVSVRIFEETAADLFLKGRGFSSKWTENPRSAAHPRGSWLTSRIKTSSPALTVDTATPWPRGPVWT